MRTRSQDQLGGATNVNDSTQGTRRKRRSSSVNTSNAGDKTLNDEDNDDQKLKTPRRQTKRQKRTGRSNAQQHLDDDNAESNVNADEAHNHDETPQTIKHVHFSASTNFTNG